MKNLILTICFLLTFNFAKCNESQYKEALPSASNLQVGNSEKMNLTSGKEYSNHNIKRILGCWNGMYLRQLKIDENEIIDLSRREKSAYEEREFSNNKPLTGMETGERYLIETEHNFPKESSVKFILFEFLSDGTIGISSYETYKDFEKNKFTGQGVFGKVNCKN